MADIMTIGEVSKRSGVASSALRFYEDKGLITSQRADSGHRRYHRSVLRRIAFITFAQRLGMDLAEIGEELARLPGGHVPTADDWAELSGQWMARIDDRMAQLERLREGLTHCIGCGCLSVDNCWIANTDDRRSVEGPGPRSWM